MLGEKAPVIDPYHVYHVYIQLVGHVYMFFFQLEQSLFCKKYQNESTHLHTTRTTLTGLM
jgi:hypothetical protein